MSEKNCKKYLSTFEKTKETIQPSLIIYLIYIFLILSNIDLFFSFAFSTYGYPESWSDLYSSNSEHPWYFLVVAL